MFHSGTHEKKIVANEERFHLWIAEDEKNQTRRELNTNNNTVWFEYSIDFDKINTNKEKKKNKSGLVDFIRNIY